MNKIILLLLCLCIMNCPIFAQGSLQQSKDGVDTDISEQNSEDEDSQDSEDSDDFYNEIIYQQYGSDMSPAFMNRENINPNESDYGYGSTDGIY